MESNTTSKSCTDCIFFIAHNNEKAQQRAYGGAVHFDSCSKTGRFLSPSDAFVTDEDRRTEYLEEVAEGCGQYDSIPDPSVHRVPTHRSRRTPLQFALQADTSIPDKVGKARDSLVRRNIYVHTSSGGVGPQGTKSCASCIFRMDPVAAQGHFGVTGAVCLARGGILPDSEGSNRGTASECSMFEQVLPPESLLDFKNELHHGLLGEFMVTPGLQEFMSINDSVGYTIRERIEASKPFEFVEPTTYETDVEVTEEDKADGIRAWRKLYSTNGERSVAIPIFDPEFFSEDERKKIPQSGDKEHPELYQDHPNNAFKVATLWFKMDETPLLQGVPGTGKTEFFRHMSWLMQIPFERISITGSSELDDLAGKMLFENNETVFQKGRIPKAWEKPSVLCLDEPNVGPLEVWQFIRPLTDNSKQLVLDMADGETVARHKYCRLGMAINPSWDSRNIGAQPLADADSNRLSHIFVDFPGEKIERNILTNRCKADNYELPEATLDKIMKVATQLREMGQAEDLPVTWGIRQQIKVARATEYFDLEDCYRMAATDNLEPEIADTILNVVRMVERGNVYAQGGFSTISSRF